MADMLSRARFENEGGMVLEDEEVGVEDVICRYGCLGKIVADRGELDAEEAEELFHRLGVKLSLTTAYNPEANGKVERGHGPIVRASGAKSGTGHDCYLMPCGWTELRTVR